MVIFDDRNYQTSSEFPDTNFVHPDDERQPKWIVSDDSELAERIKNAYDWQPVEDGEGNLTDIIEIPYTPSQDEINQQRTEKINQKLAEVGAACEKAIFAGIDVRGEHYALTLNDQTNISNLALQAQAGETVLYHADGKLCRPYQPEEILEIMTAAVKHKTYHTTRCNHINVWIRRTEDAAELEGIHYDSPLPEDLAASMTALLGGG